MPKSSALSRTQRAGSAKVAQETVARLRENVGWFTALSVKDQAGIAEVAETGIVSFSRWYLTDGTDTTSGAEFFDSAPRHLARAVTLKQTLQLIRLSVETVEQHVSWLGLPGRDREVREAALRFSRDVAFAAAEVYAHAAEVRGAWDARLEALLVDSLLRSDAAESLASLTSAVGWRDHPFGLVVSAHAPEREAALRVSAIRRTAATEGFDSLVGLHSGMLLVFLAGTDDPSPCVESLLGYCGAGPVVTSRVVTSMVDAGPAARAAREGWRVAHAWREAPRPVCADDLLPERLLAGDSEARNVLRDEVYARLASDETVLETVASYLGHGRSLEGTARTLYVHPNTVRYRLKKASELCGWDPIDDRESYVVRLALTVGDLDSGVL